MNKVVYIASLSHSGSTLIDLLLGCHPDVVSLGEIQNSITSLNRNRNICTCGKEIIQCEIWGTLKKELNSTSDHTFIDAYKKLLHIVREVYGKDKTITDSSKSVKTLNLLIDNKINNISVLFPLKDIRNFVISQNKRKEKAHLKKKDGLHSIYLTSLPYNIMFWYRGNQKIKKYLSSNSLNYFQFGYEELCFKPEEILRKISDFIGMDYADSMSYPNNSESHIIRGNDMRYNKEKLSGIHYDNRWFYSKKYFILNWLFYPFLDWNTNNVYQNIKAD